MKRPSEASSDPPVSKRLRNDEEAADVEMFVPAATAISLDQAFDALVERFSDKTAVEDDGESMTYRQLQEASRRIAAGMQKMPPGDDNGLPIVAVLMHRSCRWLAASLAVARMGTLLALSCDLGGEEEERRNREALAEHKPRLLVLDRSGTAASSLRSEVPVAYVEDLLLTQEPFEERRQRNEDDALYLVYTGGTTAAAKCVVQTHRMALHELETYPLFRALTCEDRILHHTSAFWGAACMGMFDLAWSCGASLVMLPRHGVNEVARAISERNITVAGIVPSLLDALDDKRCQSLRTVFTWGEPLRSSTVEFWRSRVQLLDLLIASEYWLVLYADHRKSGGFRPVQNARLTLLQAEDASLSDVVEVAPGEVGELYIAGPMVSAQGYTTAALNEGAFVELPVGPGGALIRHYRTRDLAKVLPDGTLEYCGRADGFAKVGGKWLDLASVERGLQAAGCREASLLWDEIAKVRHACVVPEAELLTQKPLAAAALKWQALVPPQTRLHVLKELPKNAATGKIARGLLLQQLRKQDTAISAQPQRPPLELSRSLALGLRLARGLVSHGALLPLTICMAPGLSTLVWRGHSNDHEGSYTENHSQNGKEEGASPTVHSNGHRPLVPLGVAERLNTWINCYRSVASYLAVKDLELLPYLCLLLLDGSITGLEALTRTLQAPMGVLGGAMFLCRWAPAWAKHLWHMAGRRHAEKHRGGSGWSWAFWLGFPGFSDSWSHHCWHSWPQGRVAGGGWQALSGIVKELQRRSVDPDEGKECQELLRCTYCWDWVPERSCTTWRQKNYCSECTEGWESYKQERCAELGVDTVSPDPTPSSTPYSTPMATPTATPRANSVAKEGEAKKSKGPSVVTIEFADYEVKLAKRNVPHGAANGSTGSGAANGHTPAQNGQASGSKVAQVLERATGLRLEDGQLAGLESLKVIILVSALRRELGVNLAAGDVIQCSTLSDLEEMVKAAQCREESNGDALRQMEDTVHQKGYPIYAIPRFWKAPVGWLISLDEVPDEKAMRIACRALVRRHIALRAVPYRSLGDEATASLCLSAITSLLVLRTLFGLDEVSSSRAPLDAAAAQGLWDAWPRVQVSPDTGGWPMCEAGGPEESSHFEWLSFETEADMRHAAWLKARSRGFRTPASMSVLFLPATASSNGKDSAFLQIAVNHAVTDAASIVPMVADLLELHRVAKTQLTQEVREGDLEVAACSLLEQCCLPAAPDGLAIAEGRLKSAVLGSKAVPGWDERLDLLHNSCPPRKRGFDHYVKFAPSAGRVLEAAASVTGIPTDHLLVAALAAALSFAQAIPEVKLTLIVPMRDGPGHGQAVSNLASTRHLSVWAQDRSLFDIAFELSSRFRRRDWHSCQLLDDNGDRLFINLRGIPAFDGASPVIEPQDTTRKPTRFVRNIVEMFADQETIHSWTMWMGLRSDVDATAFSRALRRALWGLVTCPLNPLD